MLTPTQNGCQVTVTATALNQLSICKYSELENSFTYHQRLTSKLDERKFPASIQWHRALDKLFEAGPPLVFIDVTPKRLLVCYSGLRNDREQITELAPQALD